MNVENKNGLIILTIGLGAVALAATIEDHKVTTSVPPDDFDRVGKESDIEPSLLRAFNRVENPHNIHVPSLNKNGTKDYGIMQINETTFQHYNIDPNLWMDDTVGVQIAARLLNDMKHELGSKFDLFNWISAYNVGTPTVLRKGIVNTGYVGNVYFHYLMFRAANG